MREGGECALEEWGIVRLTTVLGAGATVDIGGITADKLTNEVVMKEQRYKDIDDKEKHRMLLSDIYRALCPHKQNATINFEDIMNSLENLYSMHESTKIRTPWAAIAELKKTFQGLERRMILRAHSDLLTIVGDSISKYDVSFINHDRYSDFKNFWIQISKECPLDLFTLNYDTVLEQCFEENFIDGFGDLNEVMGVEGNSARRFQPIILEEEKGKSKILHLHGCINFARATLRIPNHNQFAFQESYMDMYKYNTYKEANEHWWGENAIITQSGDAIFNDPILFGLRKPDKILSVYPYSYYFRELQDAIIRNHSLLIIGYSCGDQYINNWLTRMMEIHGEKRRVVIVNYYDRNKTLCADARKTDKKDEVQIISDSEFDVYSKLMQEEYAGIIYSIADKVKGLPTDGKIISKDSCVRIYFEGFHTAIIKYGDEIINFLNS